MSENTNIEWCDSTFNPWIGCTKVGPGCDHCYAETLDNRKVFNGETHWGTSAKRMRTSEDYWKQPIKWNANAEKFFAKHGRRQRVFCASMADVFDNEINTEWRADLMGLIQSTPNLDWLLLTKRIGNVKGMVFRNWMYEWPKNAWLGITVVNQDEADRDIPKLLEIPATVRFLSIEPLLGAINLVYHFVEPTGQWRTHNGKRRMELRSHEKIHQVIVGGESGAAARPMHPDWVRGLRDQCLEFHVPFLFKQWGEFVTEEQTSEDLNDLYDHSDSGGWVNPNGNFELGEDAQPRSDNACHVFKIGKKKSGRLLDGVTHNGYPNSESLAATKACIAPPNKTGATP